MPGAGCSTWHLAPGTWHLAPGTWHLALSYTSASKAGGFLMKTMLTFGLAAMLVAGAVSLNAAQSAAELKVGDMAPDFTLQGTDGKTHKLSDYRGKQAVVVAWFPRAFTQGCTIECKSLAENGDKIRRYNVAYFMASTDSIEDNTKFAKPTSVTLQGRGGAAPTAVET